MASEAGIHSGFATHGPMRTPPHWQLGLRKATPGVSEYEVFNHNVRHICGPYRVESDRWWHFRGALRNFDVAGLNVTDIRISDGRVIKDNRGDDLHRGDCYFLVLQTEGVARMCQRGSEAVLQPGDCTLIDSRLASVFHVGSGLHQYSFNFPVALVTEVLGCDTSFVCRRISGVTGAGAVLSEFLRSVTRHAQSLSGADLLGSTLQLLAAVTGRSSSAPKRPDADRTAVSAREITEYVDAHVQDLLLTPQEIATHFNVSLRQLYRITAHASCTPSALIWQRRLQRARELLTRSARLPITEIAFSCGFKDGAHFSRSYRKAFGQAPRLARSREMEKVTGEL